MAKEFLVKGALCICKFGTSPGTFTVLDNTYFKINGDKLAGTTFSLGNTFDPPGFGICKVNPLTPKPCVPAITLWAKAYTTLKASSGENPLTDESTATCGCGCPDCITVVQTGQISVPGSADFQKASSEYQVDLDPMGNPAGLAEYQIPFTTNANVEQLESQPEEEDIPFEVEMINVSKGNFVPLGIPNAESDETIDDKIKISFRIKHSSAKEYHIKIKNEDDITIYEMYFLPEIIIKLDNSDEPEQSEGYLPGEYTFEWDGFNSDDIYDTTRNDNKLYVRIVGNGVNGKTSSSQKVLECGKMEVKWMDVKINKKSKSIDVLLRLDLRDGGEVGLNGETDDHIPMGTEGIRTVKKPADWDKVPAHTILDIHPPIKQRTRSFEDLKQLFYDGVQKYWSRKVEIGEEEYTVETTAIHSEKNCMDDLGLRYVTNDTPGRSSNPGSATLNPYTWVANFAYQRVYYNVGYIKREEWKYYTDDDVSEDFMHTAAHEMGHEILKEFGGASYSYNHKGTSTTLQNTKPDTPFPKAPGEIDLMKYSSDRYLPFDYYSRVIAAKEDVLGMLWLTKRKIK